MPNLCWIAGNTADRKTALAKLVKQFEGAQLMRFDGDVSCAFIEQQINTAPLFCDKRLFIIDDMPMVTTTRQSMLNNLKKMLGNIPDDSFVIINGIDPEDEKSLFSYVGGELKAKTQVFPTTIETADAPEWVVGQFLIQGKNIDIEDARVLIGLVGFDPSLNAIGVDRLRLAIEKLCHYSGRRRNITKEDVETTAFVSEESLRFHAIFDALDSRDIDRCYTVFRKMILEAGDIGPAMEKLIAQCVWRYRLLLFLREGMAKGMTKPEVARHAANFPKMSQSGQGMKMKMNLEKTEAGEMTPQWAAFAVNQALNAGQKPPVDAYSRKDIVRIINCLQECAVEIRARKTDEYLSVLADTLFLTACNKGEDHHLAAVRRSHEF